MADWQDVAGQLAQAGLPSLGALVGGMIGGPAGSMIGKAGGGLAASAIAAALGVPAEPAPIAQAIAADPSAAQVKLAQIEAQSRDYSATLADVASARAMQTVAVQSGSPVQWVPVLFSVLNYLIFGGVVVGVITGHLREDGIIVGFALGAVTSAYSFWLGSSDSSRRSADTVRDIARSTVPMQVKGVPLDRAAILAKANTL